MHSRLKEWMSTKGRRLVGLKVKGGDEYFNSKNRNIDNLDSLSGTEWIEFFSLIGQLDGMIEALRPNNNNGEFVREIINYMDEMEKDCKRIFKATGRTSIPKGSA